ncbi:MAG: NAD(P)/FAD-dependent oxidoreductase [Acidobacteria bacterium]|nr:NAD(P)/FAD-dependent oxidoreductase [Acidobacteriota bacterium]
MDIVSQQAASKPRVVIVGAGFAGLHAAKGLSTAEVLVTVVDRHNHHLFQPLLYQVATAALSPGDISYPIRSVLKKFKSSRTVLADVLDIDVAAKQVLLGDEALPYDYLILAAGSQTSYFGHDTWARVAPGLKSLEDALEMRRRILLAFEKAEREPDAARRQALLTFVVVGGGPTGVELAGAIAEISTQVMREDFRSIDPSDAQVILVEGSKRILEAFPEDLAANASKSLHDLGCWVWTGKQVSDIAEDHVMVGDRRVNAYTVLWAAGVQASPLGKKLGVETDRGGRVVVNQDLTVPGHPEIFVIGDLAKFVENGKPLPGVAPVAMQQGGHAAANVSRAIAGRALQPFHYFDKGNLATIGRARAVAHIGRLKLTGLVAWLAWLFVHVLYLIGFRNRAIVILNWAWAYVRRQRGARLIYGDVNNLIPPDSKLEDESAAELANRN